MSVFSRLFSPLRFLQKTVQNINVLASETAAFSNEELLTKSGELRRQAQEGTALDDLLPPAFALVREAAQRTLGQRHYDVQLLGGIVLHQGKIAEMATGEGKTLAATAPAYLNALAGTGVHVVTVNEYLAKRDTVWMGQIYQALGMTVACLVHEGARLYDSHFDVSKFQNGDLDQERDTRGGFLIQEDFLRPVSRREAYQADILYGTNHEFGFDYLRDNLVASLPQQVQRGYVYAIIDEVDSILIDEARTPLIISAPDQESSQYYRTFNLIAHRLEKDVDYLVDEKMKSADITPAGIDKVEKILSIGNLFAPEQMRLVHYLQECLRAYGLFQRDRDYVVKDGEVIIVDQFTGRLMWGRRYSGGLHQAIEAKEGVAVQEESRTYAQISIQNYFRLYRKLAGMTGTAQTSAEEFDKVYHLEVVTIPTHRPMIRENLPDVIYKNLDAKYAAVAADIKQRHERGQPLLVGTVSIEKNEELSRRLQLAGVPHEVLNAKNHEREATIIAQAGRGGAVTIATNMAGRGVDIILGGNPPSADEAQKVREVGGLHVIGTERHEARRIDDQLRGRSGRQGDAGSGQFFLSLEDDLLRIFGGERIQRLMTTLDIPEDTPIESRMVSRAVSQAQAKIEGINFDARKHLLDYDDVLNKQRLAIYQKRQELLKKEVPPPVPAMLDFFWMNHLENMEHLAESVRLRAYGQHDPLVEYRREGHLLFQQLLQNFETWVNENKERLLKEIPDSPRLVKASPGEQIPNSKIQNVKIGRNEPCYCGSGKKYKRCHGQ